MRTFMESIEEVFRRYRATAEAAMEQLSDAQLVESAHRPAHSVATIAWHVGGNLHSRFTDFLDSDGEKPWRDRESEFRPREGSRDEVLQAWNRGWDVLERSLAGLADSNLADTVTIRGEELSVVQALHRSLAHTAYHVGQIVHRAKELRGVDWNWLSIPPGGA